MTSSQPFVTETLNIDKMERVTNTPAGNPRWKITLVGGAVMTTRPNSADVIRLGHHLEGKSVACLVDERNRVAGLATVALVDAATLDAAAPEDNAPEQWAITVETVSADTHVHQHVIAHRVYEDRTQAQSGLSDIAATAIRSSWDRISWDNEKGTLVAESDATGEYSAHVHTWAIVRLPFLATV